MREIRETFSVPSSLVPVTNMIAPIFFQMRIKKVDIYLSDNLERGFML